jgi:pimeloyl-ACP methyl ester carboxylesterase
MTRARDIYYTSTDGLALYARDYPGPADARLNVLCLPGLTRNSRDFANLAAALSTTYRVICPDQRGRGRSAYDPDPSRYQPLTYVADMWALLDHLQIHKVAIIGTSLGGIMAMVMAATRPDRIVGAVLNDIGPEIDPAGLARIQSYVGKMAPPATWADAVAQTKALNAAIFPHMDEAHWESFTRALYREGPDGRPVLDYDPAISRNVDSGNAAPPDMWPLFDTLKATPLVVIRGGTSDILSAATMAQMRARHPQLVTVEVPGVGHAPMLDEPEARDAIIGFLKSLPA